MNVEKAGFSCCETSVLLEKVVSNALNVSNSFSLLMVIFCFIRLFFEIVLKEFLLKGGSNVHFLSRQIRSVLF
jgi:hypothetical protein